LPCLYLEDLAEFRHSAEAPTAALKRKTWVLRQKRTRNAPNWTPETDPPSPPCAAKAFGKSWELEPQTRSDGNRSFDTFLDMGWSLNRRDTPKWCKMDKTGRIMMIHIYIHTYIYIYV